MGSRVTVVCMAEIHQPPPDLDSGFTLDDEADPFVADPETTPSPPPVTPPWSPPGPGDTVVTPGGTSPGSLEEGVTLPLVGRVGDTPQPSPDGTLTLIQLPRVDSPSEPVLQPDPVFTDDDPETTGVFGDRHKLKCYTIKSPTRTSLARRKLMPKSKQKLVTQQEDAQTENTNSNTGSVELAEEPRISKLGVDNRELEEPSSKLQEENNINMSISSGAPEQSDVADVNVTKEVSTQQQPPSLLELQARYNLKPCSVVLEDFMDTMAITDLPSEDDTEDETSAAEESTTSLDTNTETASDSGKKNLAERTHPWTLDSMVQKYSGKPSTEDQEASTSSNVQTGTSSSMKKNIEKIDWMAKMAKMAPIILPLRGSGLTKPRNPGHEKYVFVQADKDPVEIEEVEVVSVRGTPPSATQCHFDVELGGVEVCFTETTPPEKGITETSPPEVGITEPCQSDECITEPCPPVVCITEISPSEECYIEPCPPEVDTTEASLHEEVPSSDIEYLQEDPYFAEQDVTCSPGPASGEEVTGLGESEVVGETQEAAKEPSPPVEVAPEEAVCPEPHLEVGGTDKQTPREGNSPVNVCETPTETVDILPNAPPTAKLLVNKQALVEDNNNVKRLTRHSLLVRAKRRNSNAKMIKNGQSTWTSGYARQKWKKVQKARSLRGRRRSSMASLKSFSGSQSGPDHEGRTTPSPKYRLRQCKVALEDCMARPSRGNQKPRYLKKRKRKRSTSSSPKTYSSGQSPLAKRGPGRPVKKRTDPPNPEAAPVVRTENHDQGADIRLRQVTGVLAAPSPTRRSQRETYSRYRRTTPDSSRENSKERQPTKTVSNTSNPVGTVGKTTTLPEKGKTVTTNSRVRQKGNASEKVKDLQKSKDDGGVDGQVSKTAVETVPGSARSHQLAIDVDVGDKRGGGAFDTGDTNITVDQCDEDGLTSPPSPGHSTATSDSGRQPSRETTTTPSNVLREHDPKQNQPVVRRSSRPTKKPQLSPIKTPPTRRKAEPRCAADSDSTDAYDYGSDPYDYVSDSDDVVVTERSSILVPPTTHIPPGVTFGLMPEPDRLMAFVEQNSPAAVARRPGRRVCVDRRKDSLKENRDSDSDSDLDDQLPFGLGRPFGKRTEVQVPAGSTSEGSVTTGPTTPGHASPADDKNTDQLQKPGNDNSQKSKDVETVAGEQDASASTHELEDPITDDFPSWSDEMATQDEGYQEAHTAPDAGARDKTTLADKYGLKKCTVLLENCMIEVVPDITISMSPKRDDDEPMCAPPAAGKKRKKMSKRKFRSHMQQLWQKRQKTKVSVEQKSHSETQVGNETPETPITSSSESVDMVFVPVEDVDRSEKTIMSSCSTSSNEPTPVDASTPVETSPPVVRTSPVPVDAHPTNDSLTADSPGPIDSPVPRNPPVVPAPTAAPPTDPTAPQRTRSRESSPGKKTHVESPPPTTSSDDKVVPPRGPLPVRPDSKPTTSEGDAPACPAETLSGGPPEDNPIVPSPLEVDPPSHKAPLVGTPGQAIRKHIKLVREVPSSPQRPGLEADVKRRRLDFSRGLPGSAHRSGSSSLQGMATALSTTKNYTTELRYGINPEPSYLMSVAGEMGVRRPGRRVAVGRRYTAPTPFTSAAKPCSDTDGED